MKGLVLLIFYLAVASCSTDQSNLVERIPGSASGLLLPKKKLFGPNCFQQALFASGLSNHYTHIVELEYINYLNSCEELKSHTKDSIAVKWATEDDGKEYPHHSYYLSSENKIIEIGTPHIEDNPRTSLFDKGFLDKYTIFYKCTKPFRSKENLEIFSEVLTHLSSMQDVQNNTCDTISLIENEVDIIRTKLLSDENKHLAIKMLGTLASVFMQIEQISYTLNSSLDDENPSVDPKYSLEVSADCQKRFYSLYQNILLLNTQYFKKFESVMSKEESTFSLSIASAKYLDFEKYSGQYFKAFGSAAFRSLDIDIVNKYFSMLKGQDKEESVSSLIYVMNEFCHFTQGKALSPSCKKIKALKKSIKDR